MRSGHSGISRPPRLGRDSRIVPFGRGERLGLKTHVTNGALRQL